MRGEREHLAMFVMSMPSCVATRSEGSEKSRRRAEVRTPAFSSDGTLDHSLVPSVLRQELPTEFLATTAASNRIDCSTEREF